ncbi:MAG TPA: serine/threonine-protein kinase, partial [Gemmatimonadaceae bacterium]
MRRHATVQERDQGPAELGELAADYVISGELGRGSSAVVYLARDRALDRQVAIKLVRAGRADDELLERSAQEARLLASLPHNPNIVAIYAVRRLARRSLALVMQYVAGPTLREVLARDGALPTEQAVRVLRDLARALHFAHDHGIVHRDVKPENVYLDAATGRALLSDFGSAVSLHADPRMTTTGAVIGTPAYMSPEQVDGERVDGRSDIYSLGLVGWEMLTGRFPWGTSNLYEILYRQRHTDLPLLDELRPDLPTPVINAVEGALLRDREARWPDAATMLAALLAPPDVPRIPLRPVTNPTPDELPTEAVHEQHAQTLQLTPGDRGAAGASAAPAGEAAGPPPAASAASIVPDEEEELAAAEEGAVPADTLEWRSARLSGPYAWTPPS